ncbi:MAG: MarC family protein [Candidatus Methanomethylophilaceae archaeon]
MDVGILLQMSVSLFLILDPFASLPMFISITKGLDKPTVHSYANKSILVASLLLVIFLFFGTQIMDLFGVTMDSFRVAGGIIFLMMSIELVFGLKLSKNTEEKGAAWAVIASPVLTGPGVITAAILFSVEYGLVPALVASIIALAFTWVILWSSEWVMKVAGEQSISIMTRIIGLFIAAMAVQNIFSGSLHWFQANSDILTATLAALI